MTSQLASQQLPPSPPPSPPHTRHRGRKKKQDDPFLSLSTPLPSPSPPASPENEAQEPPEPLIHRLFLTPLLFTSFLISLFLINLRDRAYRLSQHRSPTADNILAYLSPTAWLDPEPYQDPDDSTWDRRDSTAHVEPHSALNPAAATAVGDEARLREKQDQKRKNRKSSWHLRKKIRKVVKMEVSDAFDMRGRVIVGMVFVWAVTGVAFFLGLKWMVGLVW